ncbi:MAG: hypothetical protein EOP84_17655 [Verrucomicrobiaceae bacterium]|nr:MAG: hypothetical protein EOP84_17655 [Verrucomicrobiaceae bacterium]
MTPHEWLLGRRPSSEDFGDEPIPSEIKDWLLKGCAPKAEDRFASVDEMRSALRRALEPPILDLVPTETELSSPLEPAPAELTSTQFSGTSALPGEEILSDAADHERPVTDPNPFVPYLNSLHSGTAASENALAESQALNPFFKFIHVAHPLANLIEDTLRGEKKCHVILTGHAGDGKTTISVEVLKRLRGLPIDAELHDHLQPREDAGNVSLIKDFSEWSPAGRADLLKEMLEPREGRFLLVSNTGTLLETFKTHEEGRGGNFVAMESELLTAMSSSKPAELSVGDTHFILINVAMLDNLALARKIFERMLAPERWNACSNAACRATCPIHQNVSLLQSNQSLVLDRLFLAYRRIYEYGTRLTLRQLTGHLAYLITAGLDYQQIAGFAIKAKRPALSKFLFFNRFFGDDGVELDPVAAPLRGVQAVRQQAFGSEPCPTWERRMWLRSRGTTFQLEADAIPDDFSSLRECAAGSPEDKNIRPEHARMQVRRAVFFLHKFGGDEGDQFLRNFLRSNMVLDFVRWQQAGSGDLSLLEGSRLKSRIMHVLQEHFTGVRLPEGGSPDRQLLVTLSRRSGDIRQSAQIVLAKYREDEFEISLRSEPSAAGGIRRNLFLV